MKTIARWLVGSLALALAYVILAKVSDLRFIPTLNVSLVWLPAGLGAAATLRWGIPALPAIFTGALIHKWETLGDIPFAVLLISLGSTLQAGVVAVLAGKLAQVGVYSPSRSGGSRHNPVSLTARLCGALAAGVFTAPTIGAITLCASGVNPWTQFLSIWWGWWTSDFIAALLITPVAWHALQRVQGRDGLGDWLIPLAISMIALGPLAYELHEIVETGKSVQRSSFDGTVLLNSIQGGISLAIMGTFALLGVTLIILSRMHSIAAQENKRSMDAITSKEALLYKALSASRSVAYICCASGDFGAIYVHDSIRAMAGHTPEEFIARSDFWEIHIHPEDRPAVFARLSALIESGTTCHHEYRFRAADGRYVWVSDQLTLERDGEGRPLQISGIMTDITKRKSVEDHLRESQKLEAIGQLTGGLAHDFNNLLGIVVGNLDEIGRRLPEGDALIRRQHRIALEAALRGAEVTRSLLAVARRQPLEVGIYDVNALLAEFLPLAKSSAGSAVALGSDLAPGELPARLDAAGLSNVILNLVINARDAMQEGTGERRITLRTRRTPIAPGADEALAPGWYALIEVADTGAGMSEQVRAQAFEPFFTTKERGHGTGLGLAMVYGYATQLGGTARIQSEPGRGTTVQLYLPLDTQATVAAEAAEAQRLAALQSHAILDTAPEEEFDRLVAEAARLCEVPIALVSLVDEHRQWFKAKVGLQASQTAREQAFCAHAIIDPGSMLVVPDATRDARFSANPLVTGEPCVRFYAGVVLHDAAGEALGTLCVIDHRPRQLNAAQLAELAVLAEQVAALIRAQRLPRTAPDVALPALARTTTPPAPAPLGANQGPRVLVVDDAQALCELACDWLESLGYQPTGVHSPAAALERLATEPFDILFTDIVMPGGMDGLALAREARSRHPHLRVVLTSGYAQGLNDNPDLPGTMISKPYRKNDLLSAFT